MANIASPAIKIFLFISLPCFKLLKINAIGLSTCAAAHNKIEAGDGDVSSHHAIMAKDQFDCNLALNHSFARSPHGFVYKAFLTQLLNSR